MKSIPPKLCNRRSSGFQGRHGNGFARAGFCPVRQVITTRHRKKDRLFELIERMRLPTIFFAEGGGGRPGDTDYPVVSALDTRAFALWAGLSGLVPRIAVVKADLTLEEFKAAVDKGGIVVCGGIHMSDVPSFPYALLWEERSIKSVANLTRGDGEEFLAIAPQVPVKSQVRPSLGARLSQKLLNLI